MSTDQCFFFFFFSPILMWCTPGGDYPEDDLANFGYRNIWMEIL
jgi:hypothetical protein